jgi:MFS family permease
MREEYFPMSRSRILILCLALFLFQLGVNYYVVGSANRQQVLTGEEASVDFRDPVLLTQRIQHNPMATPFTAFTFYLVGSHVVPNVDLFFGRWWKATFMALLPPVLFLYGRRRLSLSWPAAATAAALTGLLPTIVSFSWLGTDHGLEVLFGFAGLLCLSTGVGPLLVLGGLLTGLGALMAVGVAFFPVVFCELALYWKDRKTRESVLWAGGAVAALLFAMVLPALWWSNSARLLMGGGELIWPLGPLLKRNGLLLLKELFSEGQSYYYFNRFPALSNPWLAVAVIAGIAACVPRWRSWWPLYVLGGGVLGIVLVAGGVPGIRRALILSPVAALFVGGLVDELRARLAPRVSPKAAWAAIAVFVATLVAMPAYQAAAVANQYVSRQIVLPLDFEYPMAPGKSMVETTEILLDNPAILYQNPLFFTFDRLTTILHVLAERNGKPVGEAVPIDRIVEEWRRQEPVLKTFKPRTVL